MTDQAATILAFAISFGVLAGYGVGVLSRLRRERARQDMAKRAGETLVSPKNAVITETKPETPVKTS
ncbi:MAG: hypothetical protein U0638_10505 [Phycisphaerales bacterium]